MAIILAIYDLEIVEFLMEAENCFVLDSSDHGGSWSIGQKINLM